jgi:mannose-6-phosphate isomerase class I
MCLNGKVEIRYDEEGSVEVEKGETVLIPANMDYLKFIPHPDAKLLEIFIEDDENKTTPD